MEQGRSCESVSRAREVNEGAGQAGSQEAAEQANRRGKETEATGYNGKRQRLRQSTSSDRISRENKHF